MDYLCDECGSKIKIYEDEENGECFGECSGCYKLFTEHDAFRELVILG